MTTVPVSEPRTREEETRRRAREAMMRPLVIEPVTIFVADRLGDQRFGHLIPISVARVRAMEPAA